MAEQMMQGAAGKTIPAGYKQTEVGVIPEDWDVVSVSSLISSIGSGVSVNSVDKINAFSHGMHVLKTSCVSEGGFLPDEKKSILPSDIHRAKCSPAKGDIIVSRMNTPMLVGELGYVPVDIEDSFLPDRLWLMKFKNSEDIDPRWLSWLLSSSTFSKKIKESATGTSGSMKNISKDTFLAMLVPKPVFKEQEIIATALADTDSLIAGLEQLIAKKQAIKTATMQQLLTGRTRLPQFALRPDGTSKGYKSSELGQIPEDWGGCCLGDRTNYIGSGKTTTKTSGEFPLYGSTGLIGTCNNPEYNGSAILVARVGANAGKLNFVDGIYGVSDNTIIINFKEDAYIHYFKYVLIKKNINTLVFGSGQPLITGTQLKELLIAEPIFEEQIAIATILSDMDSELTVLEQKLTKARALKQGMMQQLLTGRIRLPLEVVA